ncbi:MAG: hypothetical protein RMK99_01870 [Anaerolineales bacterium]|nr:hypothetical protein [Anaerolineales bacterium]
MTNDFLGAWRVSEYVYNPDGAFVGVVHQHRRLERLANGNLQVWQFCEPCDFDHPMAKRVGEYVFDLRVEGRVRRYLGPDVIGVGLSWGEGALTGSGFWPRFGYSFTSFSIQTGAGRQVTGGKFFEAGAMMANIIGVAEVESSEVESRGWPRFEGPSWPGEVSMLWRGTVTVVSGEGTVVAEHAAERRYDRSGWEDAHDADAVRLQENSGAFRAFSKNMQGLARRYGWMLEGELFNECGACLTWMELLSGAQLTGLRRWQQDGVITRVEVLRLTPI